MMDDLVFMMIVDSLNGRHGLFRRLFITLCLGLVFSTGLSIAQVMAKPVKIVAFGDSLTAGYGLPVEQSYPVKLQAALKAKGFDVEISNAGVSGDTSSGGLARLDWSVGDDVDLVIVELGANDALRGIDPAITRKALTAIVSKLRRTGKKVLLAGMLAPPNLGPEYGAQLKAIYKDLGKWDGVTLYPFFLAGVAAQPELNQPDGLHPTAKGVEEIVRRLLPVVEKMLNSGSCSRCAQSLQGIN